MVDDQRPVGTHPHVELDAVGSQAVRLQERLQGVLPVAGRRPSVGYDRNIRLGRQNSGSPSLQLATAAATLESPENPRTSSGREVHVNEFTIPLIGAEEAWLWP